MIFSFSLLLNGGLFDFDLTFLGEGLFFLIFSIIVTYIFLVPVSKQLDERAKFIDFNQKKSHIILAFATKKLLNCVELLVDEVTELNRQLKLTKEFVNIQFEEEIEAVKKESEKLLSQLKGELTIKSAALLFKLSPELNNITDSYFYRRFPLFNKK
jgi:hypothetical protein